MKKRRLVLASILKPVDDVRMSEKLGATLAKLPASEVIIIGYPAAAPPTNSSVIQMPLSRFKRLSMARLLAPVEVLRKCIKVKPDLLVVNTHELLIVAVINRILFGTRVCYDIRENYFHNIWYTSTFWIGLRPLLGAWVRLKEWLLAPFFLQFFLAEKSYAHELGFIGNKYLVLENKAVLPEGFTRKPDPEKRQLLFTGTLAASTGVFEAIEITKKLHEVDSRFTLNILGYCPIPATLNRIQQAIDRCPFISLTGGDKLVPHELIRNAIQASYAGIISYPDSPHLNRKMPTKLYEYTAGKLPILLTLNPLWVEFCAPFPAAVPVDFGNPDLPDILRQLDSTLYYTTPSDHVFWHSEEPALLAWLNKIFI